MTEPTIGVTGFGRCGSTMVMAMLNAGGLPPVKGSDPLSYELPDVRLAFSLPPGALDGRAVKLLDSVTYYGIVPVDEWQFVWVDRDYRQQAKSYVKFCNHFLSGLIDVPDTIAEDRIAKSYAVDRPTVLGLYRAAGTVLVLKYERVLADPLKAAQALRRLVPQLDVLAAAEAVHRRSPECRPDLNFELEGACP